MLSKAILALAAASLVKDVVAAGPNQHGHQHMHQKKALVTEVVTVTEHVTVTLSDNGFKAQGEATSTKKFYTHSRKTRSRRPRPSATTTISAPIAVPTPEQAAPTTIITQTKESAPASSVAAAAAPVADPAPVEVEPAAPVQSQSAPAPSSNPAPASAPVLSGGPKRGLAYNDPNLLGRFLSTGSRIGWTYNWGQLDDSKTGLEFVPTLWGTTKGFPATWAGNAQKGLDAGSKCLFSFNEPDLDSQSNMSPQDAAKAHIELMGPFQGKARIGTPSITNSGAAGQGTRWLQAWFDACAGNCPADFVNIHIYGFDTATFLRYLLDVYQQFNKPVWISEFGFGGSEEEIDNQLGYIIDQLENNATYSFVERYAYFMAAEGILTRGNSLSTYGNTFAYGV